MARCQTFCGYAWHNKNNVQIKFGKQKQCEFFSRISVMSAIKYGTSGLRRENSGSGTKKKLSKN